MMPFLKLRISGKTHTGSIEGAGFTDFSLLLTHKLAGQGKEEANKNPYKCKMPCLV